MKVWFKHDAFCGYEMKYKDREAAEIAVLAVLRWEINAYHDGEQSEELERDFKQAHDEFLRDGKINWGQVTAELED